MHCFLKFFAASLLCALPARSDEKPLPVTALPFSLRDEVEVLQIIAASPDQALRNSLKLDPDDFISMRLMWNQRISLDGEDHVLCLFDSQGHVFPGNNPRVLVLFTSGYKVAAWGSFACEPFFGYGSIVSSLTAKPDTRFITVNPSGRFGGALWFEEYLISPRKIQKLGEGPSYPFNSKQESETK